MEELPCLDVELKKAGCRVKALKVTSVSFFSYHFLPIVKLHFQHSYHVLSVFFIFLFWLSDSFYGS